jgi:hypothetical protein
VNVGMGLETIQIQQKSKVDVSEIDFYLRVAESSPKHSRGSLIVLKRELYLSAWQKRLHK